jgi:hypothetical protein
MQPTPQSCPLQPTTSYCAKSGRRHLALPAPSAAHIRAMSSLLCAKATLLCRHTTFQYQSRLNSLSSLGYSSAQQAAAALSYGIQMGGHEAITIKLDGTITFFLRWVSPHQELVTVRQLSSGPRHCAVTEQVVHGDGEQIPSGCQHPWVEALPSRAHSNWGDAYAMVAASGPWPRETDSALGK